MWFYFARRTRDLDTLSSLKRVVQVSSTAQDDVVPGKGDYIQYSFISSWYHCAWKSPYMLHPVSQEVKFLPGCPQNRRYVGLVEHRPSLTLDGRSLAASFLQISMLFPPEDQCPDVLVFSYSDPFNGTVERHPPRQLEIEEGPPLSQVLVPVTDILVLQRLPCQ